MQDLRTLTETATTGNNIMNLIDAISFAEFLTFTIADEIIHVMIIDSEFRVFVGFDVAPDGYHIVVGYKDGIML
jgi:hypothetical protein